MSSTPMIRLTLTASGKGMQERLSQPPCYGSLIGLSL
jgi:hypothetical protein